MYSTTRSRIGRKRQSSESSADAPKTKKKKSRAKDSPLLSAHAQSPPLEATPTPTQAAVTAKTSTKSKRGSPSKATKTAEAPRESESPIVQEPSPTASPSAAKKPSHRKYAKSKNYYFKPHNKSWMSHIAAVVVYRCISEAMRRSFDPRVHLSDINWTLMVEGLLSSEDMKKVWYYIGKEFPDTSLEEIAVNLQPYADLSIDQLAREDIRIKYKDQMPKPPVSAYFLFSASKGPKLKKKHPSLSQTELAVRLGKRWKSIGAEKQDKYKQQYVALKAKYEEELEQFYLDHPDARPPAPISKKKTRKISAASPEERKFQELKAVMPKPPMSGYLLFCKAKREKMHRKHSELSPREVTIRLGKKWQAIGEEGRAKYKKAYEKSIPTYKQQLEEFYAQNPDAKEIIQMGKKKRASKTSRSQTSVWTQTQQSPSSPEEIQESPLATIREEESGSKNGLQVDLSEGHSQEQNEASSGSEEDSDFSDSDDD